MLELTRHKVLHLSETDFGGSTDILWRLRELSDSCEECTSVNNVLVLEFKVRPKKCVSAVYHIKLAR